MLSWHYRSHYETLISYSNHAFYGASLLTIPDKTIHHKEKRVIEVTKPDDAIDHIDCLYDRSISFHFHPNSVYEKRNNQDEANYIAQLVRELLKKKVNESIGIVAFSQEQQQTIEDALTALAQTDKEFDTADNRHMFFSPAENYVKPFLTTFLINGPEIHDHFLFRIKSITNTHNDNIPFVALDILKVFNDESHELVMLGPRIRFF